MVNIKETTEEARQAFDEIIDLLTALPATKLNEIPFEGSWTAGQLGQHIILSAGGFVEVINGPTSETKRDPEEKVQAIRGMFLDFSFKMKSPESIVPEEKQYQLIALLEKLLDIKEKFLASIKTLDL
ncbi:MAG: DinB family protein, partial [Pedobacter sp.]|nr:DinB family protein [Pedobacter sp.]